MIVFLCCIAYYDMFEKRLFQLLSQQPNRNLIYMMTDTLQVYDEIFKSSENKLGLS